MDSQQRQNSNEMMIEGDARKRGFVGVSRERSAISDSLCTDLLNKVLFARRIAHISYFSIHT